MKTKTLIIGIAVLFVGLLVSMNLYNRHIGNTQSPSFNNSHNQASVSNSSEQKKLSPDFSLENLDGGVITLSEYRGKKPVVLDFWASWCHNCRRDMPKLNGFYEKHKDNVEVIGINLQESQRVAQKFVDSENISFPIALDSTGRASRSFGIRYTNTHILIDKDGNLVKTIPGDIKESDIISLINL